MLDKGCHLYQPAGSTQWTPITCDATVGKWEIVLMDGLPQEELLEKSTSLTYDSQTHQVTLTTLSGATATLKLASTGVDCTTKLSTSSPSASNHSNSNHSADQIVITLNSQTLVPGTYVLTLKKGTDKKEIELVF